MDAHSLEVTALSLLDPCTLSCNTMFAQQEEAFDIFWNYQNHCRIQHTPCYGGRMRLFPYAWLITDKFQLQLRRILSLAGVINMLSISEGSYREKSEWEFGCLDFIGKKFEVEVEVEGTVWYDEYIRRQSEKKKGGTRMRKRSLFLWWLSRRGTSSEKFSMMIKKMIATAVVKNSISRRRDFNFHIRKRAWGSNNGFVYR